MSSLNQSTGLLMAAQPTTTVLSTPRSKPAPSGQPFLGKALYWMGRFFLDAYMRVNLDVDVLRHVPLPAGPMILAANHPTTMDPFYILTLLPEPVSVLVTTAAFDVPGFGSYLRATGHVPAVRGSGGVTVDAIARQIEAGRTVAIFPEGALSPQGGGFHQPHSGVARVALRTGVPVIPIGIGVQRDRIRVTETHKDGENVIAHLYPSGPYAMTVGRPLTFHGDVRDDERVHTVAGHIMNQIRNLATESDLRIQPAAAAALLEGAAL